jgi:hypothetical protein
MFMERMFSLAMRLRSALPFAMSGGILRQDGADGFILIAGQYRIRITANGPDEFRGIVSAE